ncbi:hypothetical protein DL770_006656 [Monosporascus sp. CRB-9-2]|nr:hypothetical protein DL770_006656 [Monosporascus sp. CRB-9-2]
MMEISTVNSEFGEEEVKLKDEFVDRQYQYVDSSSLDEQDEQDEQEPPKYCRNPTIAYLALRVQDREKFRGKLEEKKRERIGRELARIDRIRKQFSSDEKKKSLIEKLENTKKEWKEEVARNVSSFQRDLENAQKTLQDWRRNTELPEVLRDLEKLGADRLQSKYQRHSMLFRNLARWGTDGSRPNDVSKHPNTNRRGSFFGRKKPGLDQPTQSQPAPAISEDPPPNNAAGDGGPESMYGFRAYAMYFKKAEGKEIWQGYEHPEYKGRFPNQKIWMDKILNEEQEHENPLMQKCPPDTIRYFHFPTNNMFWIETAIARYYNERPRGIGDRKRGDPKPEKTQKLLAREFWRGQMHGTGSASADPVQGDQSSNSDSLSSPTGGSFPQKDKNIALFLPYLHWETSSRRAKMVQVINEVMGCEVKPPKISNVVEEAEKEHSKSRGNPKHEPPPKYKTLLGKYLMTVAKVADEMDFEADERLLRKYIKADPPLHVRRTLDQYYFVTLDDTSQRDKDQVVYRGTKAGHSLHSRSTRVVMVDQLWLWILDDNTIITSFPRRWGRNKPDSSGVHKSLRERLDKRRDEIKSIYHLALIIIDQCSRVFFDRTKPLDERPEVMDLFASAIGDVTEMTSIAYDSFWKHTDLQAKNMLPNSPRNAGNKYLNINPEGILFKEAQDIAEELKIMKRIYTEQLNVVKDFKRHICHPTGKDTTQGDTAVLKKLLLDIAKNQTASNDRIGRSDDEGTPPESKASETASNDGIGRSDDEGTRSKPKASEATLHEAEAALELIESRQAEIQDLEDSALRTSQQLKDLLSLKQQQASIVEAKAALQRADESVRQGRAIMAFTIVTIFFLPLGFFAAFFGMNNADINDATWMSLNDQIKYMFGLSAVVITISISIAFSPWIRAIIRIVLRVPYQVLDEYTQVWSRLAESPLNHVTLEWKTNRWLQGRKNRRMARQKEKKDARDGPKVAGAARLRSSPDRAGSAAWWPTGAALRRGTGRAQDGLV